MSTSRYPGWTISKVSDAEYFMRRDAGVYGIRVKYEGPVLNWMGSLETRRKGVWAAYKAPFRHCVAGCVQEAEDRASWAKKFDARLARSRT